MFLLFILSIFLSTSSGDIVYNWNKHAVEVKVYGELQARDHLLDNFHFIGDSDLLDFRKVIYSFPADNGYVWI